MATIVGGLMVPHVPLISALPELPPLAKREATMGAFRATARRIQELGASTVVVVGDDHYTLFGPHCLPRCLIAIGDVEGPVEPWLGIAKREVENNQPLARHIMQYGFDHGVDWAVSKTMVLDHSAMVPIEFAIRPCAGVKVIPVYLSCAVEPLITSRRAREIGRVIGDAIRAFPSDERVVMMGTGGLSHWVGMAKMGQINESWDRQVLELIVKGDLDALCAMADDSIIETAGNGALEIKNWITAIAALGGATGRIIDYTPVHEWVTGCGFVEMTARAA